MIAFSSLRDDNGEVHVMDVDGNNQRNLTNNPTTDDWPTSWFDLAVRSVPITSKLISMWGWIKQGSEC